MERLRVGANSKDEIRAQVAQASLRGTDIELQLGPPGVSALCIEPFERVTILNVVFDRTSGSGMLYELPPIVLVNLPRLRQLIVSGNRLTTLPMAIGRCKELVTVDVYSGSLTRLPPTARRAAAFHLCHNPVKGRYFETFGCDVGGGAVAVAFWRRPRRAALALLRLSGNGSRLHRDLVRMVGQAILWTANETEWN
jgi:Leucine-rich repeat (LRR) protein